MTCKLFEKHLFSYWPHSAYWLRLDCVRCLLGQILVLGFVTKIPFVFRVQLESMQSVMKEKT